MKLLIVDDEELTRTGVISSINWESLGITEIFQADDGINGLQIAQTCSRKLYSVMCVCPEWTALQCWNAWKQFSRIPFRFL